jgi:hypothetical protein
MKKIFVINLIVVPALILAAIVALLAFGPKSALKESSRPSLGMGDLHRFETRQSSTYGEAQVSSRIYTGVGDLRRFEAQILIPNTGAQTSSYSYAGMGDLHCFEAGQLSPAFEKQVR